MIPAQWYLLSLFAIDFLTMTQIPLSPQIVHLCIPFLFLAELEIVFQSIAICFLSVVAFFTVSKDSRYFNTGNIGRPSLFNNIYRFLLPSMITS